MIMNQKAAVKARKPGISRTDCRTPTSQPVKWAVSLAKLLNRACQLANPSQFTKATVIRKAVGEANKASRPAARSIAVLAGPGAPVIPLRRRRSGFGLDPCHRAFAPRRQP